MTHERKTSKTDFMRWLDQNPPSNDPRYNRLRGHEKHWGAYLRREYPANFNQLYQDFWLAHPERWDEPYRDNVPEEMIPFA
jgi:hypothetical protein